MADTAAHLIDHVLPRAPYRQWVFTLPKPLRLRLARDPTWARWAGQLVMPWADLLRRVFADDVLQCKCGGRRSIIAVVTNPTIARTLLVALDLPHEPSAFAPARDPPQVEFVWEGPA